MILCRMCHDTDSDVQSVRRTDEASMVQWAKTGRRGGEDGEFSDEQI